MLPKIFCSNLRAAIDADPRSIKTLSNLAGYSESYVGRVLNGKKPNPTLLFVHCFAAALNRDPLDLLKARP